MTRAEHLDFCKQRAREYLDRGDATNAIASMLSDLSKHEETRGLGEKMVIIGMFACRSVTEARRFIEGFN